MPSACVSQGTLEYTAPSLLPIAFRDLPTKRLGPDAGPGEYLVHGGESEWGL